MELLAHGLHVGLFLDELAGALPMVAAFAVWGQRQQVRARIANSVEHFGNGWGTSFSARYTCRNIIVVVGPVSFSILPLLRLPRPTPHYTCLCRPKLRLWDFTKTMSGLSWRVSILPNDTMGLSSFTASN